MHSWHWLGRLSPQNRAGMGPQDQRMKIHPVPNGTWARRGFSQIPAPQGLGVEWLKRAESEGQDPTSGFLPMLTQIFLDLSVDMAFSHGYT